MTIAVEGTSSSGTTTTSPLSYAHTLGSGRARMLVVGVGLEHNGTGDVTAVSYNSTAMTLVVKHEIGSGSFHKQVSLWYLLDADFPAGGNVSVTATGTITDINSGAINFERVKQKGPTAIACNDDDERQDLTIDTTITLPTESAMLVDIVGSSTDLNWAPDAGQTEEIEVSGSDSSIAMSVEIPADGDLSEALGWTASGGTSFFMAHVIMALEPANPIVHEFATLLQSSTSSSYTAPHPANLKVGDLMAVAFSTDDNGEDHASSHTFTEEQTPISNGDQTHSYWSKIATAADVSRGDSDWTTSTTEQAVIGTLRITNFDPAGPVEGVVTNTGSSNAPQSPTRTPTADDTIVIRTDSADDDDVTTDTGFPTGHVGVYHRPSNETGAGTVTQGQAYRDEGAATAAGTADWSLSASEGWAAFTLHIVPAGELGERIVGDCTRVTDEVTIELTESPGERVVSDAVTVTDTLAVTVTFERGESDTVTVVDQTIAAKTIDPDDINDTVTVVDAITVETDYVRSQSDSIIVTDDLCETNQVRTTIGHFQSPTSTGTVEIRNLPFQPVGIIFWGVRESGFAAEGTPDSTMMLGVAANGSVGKSLTVVGEDAATNDERFADESDSINQISNAGVRIVEGDVSSYVSDGFDVNFTIVDASEYRIFFTAFGGDGVQAAAGQVTVNDGEVTGLGFSPDCAFVGTGGQGPGDPPTATDFGVQGFGFVNMLTGDEWWVGSYGGNNDNVNKDSVLSSSGHVGQMFDGNITWEMAFTARTNDGWTWAGANTDEVHYLALNLGGRRISVGTFTAVTASDPQTQNMPDLGFTRSELILFGSGNEIDEVGTTPNGSKVSMAFATPVAGLLSVLRTDEAGINDANQQSTDQALLFGNIAGVALREGTITSFQSSTPAIVWDPNDTTNAIIIGYVAIEGCNISSMVYSRIVSDTATVADQISVESLEQAINDFVDVCDLVQVELNTPVNDFYGVIICDGLRVADEVTIEVTTDAGDTIERTESETVAVTDQIVVALEYGRVVSDAVTVTDQIVVALEYGRVASDTVAVTDQIVVALEYGRVISDTVAVTDQIVVALEYERTISDAVTVVDQIVVALGHERVVSDTATVVDQIVVALEYERTISDAVTVADQASIEVIITINDSVTVVDQTNAETDYVRVISDAVTVVDQASVEVTATENDTITVVDQVLAETDYVRTASDAVTVADQASIEVGTGANDTATVVDQIVVALEYERTISDAATVADQVLVEKEIGANLSDAVAVTDAVVVTLEYGRVISDAVTVADQTQSETDYVRIVSDSVSVVDQLSIEFGASENDNVAVADQIVIAVEYGRVASDAVTVVDQIVVEFAKELTLSDSVAVTDQIVVTLEYERVASDAVSVTDDTRREHDAHRPITDNVTVVDAIGPEVVFQEDDSVTVVDQLVTEVDYIRIISDTVSAVDAVQVQLAGILSIEIGDSIDVVDSVARIHDAVRTVSDAVAVADQVLREAEFERSASDSVTAVDVVGPEVSPSESDSVTVADQVLAETDYVRAAADTVTVVDQALVTVTLEVSIDDSVSVVDTVVASTVYDKTISDAVTVADAVAREAEFGRVISDSVVVTDQVTAGFETSTADSVTVADQIVTEVDYVRPVVDTVAVVDQVSTSVTSAVANTDAVTVADQAIASVEFGRVISDAVTVVDVTQREHDASRTIGDIVTVGDQTSAVAGQIISVEVSDAVTVADQLVTEADYVRTASDAVTVVDQLVTDLEEFFQVIIGDSVDVADLVSPEQDVSITIGDSVAVTDQIQLQVGGESIISDVVAVVDQVLVSVDFTRQAADSVTTTDAVSAQTIKEIAQPDFAIVTDLLQVEVDYNRSASDSIDVDSDFVFIGDIVLKGDAIGELSPAGPVDAYSVHPRGPVSASGDF